MNVPSSRVYNVDMKFHNIRARLAEDSARRSPIRQAIVDLTPSWLMPFELLRDWSEKGYIGRSTPEADAFFEKMALLEDNLGKDPGVADPEL